MARDGSGRILARERLQSVRYSRFVARAKLFLPLATAAMILMLGAWPSFSTGVERLLAKVPRIDLTRSGDFRMLNPRYTGLDKDQRPFTVTADAAREQGVNNGSGDALVALDGPKADILTKEGAWIVVSGKTGVYQPGAHFLDLFGDVTLFHDKGYQFKTRTARVDLDAGAAVGHDSVAGGGPSGTLSGEGFRILQKGDIIKVTGKSELVMNGVHSDSGN